MRTIPHAPPDWSIGVDRRPPTQPNKSTNRRSMLVETEARTMVPTLRFFLSLSLLLLGRCAAFTLPSLSSSDRCAPVCVSAAMIDGGDHLTSAVVNEGCEAALLLPGQSVRIQIGDVAASRKAWKKRRRNSSPILIPASVLYVFLSRNYPQTDGSLTSLTTFVWWRKKGGCRGSGCCGSA